MKDLNPTIEILRRRLKVCEREAKLWKYEVLLEKSLKEQIASLEYAISVLEGEERNCPVCGCNKMQHDIGSSTCLNIMCTYKSFAKVEPTKTFEK